MPFLFYNPSYLLFALPAMLFAMWAQWRVQSAYQKWSQVTNARRISGVDVARTLMQGEGLGHVQVERTPGMLTDHYDPRGKVMRLSEGSMQPSIAAMAIVAHELGHAAQDKEGYFWLRARSGIVGLAAVGSNLGTMLFVAGLALGALAGQRGGFGWGMAIAGLLLFSVAVLFTLITLPVELNASQRARQMLARQGLLTSEEASGVNAVLGAAALTYVAAAAQSIAQLLYFLSILSRRRN